MYELFILNSDSYTSFIFETLELAKKSACKSIVEHFVNISEELKSHLSDLKNTLGKQISSELISSYNEEIEMLETAAEKFNNQKYDDLIDTYNTYYEDYFSFEDKLPMSISEFKPYNKIVPVLFY